MALCTLFLAVGSSLAATLQSADGSSVSGDIAFTTSGSVFINTGDRQVTRLKKKDLAASSVGTVEAWEASNPQDSNLSTKFDAKPQPVTIKNPERTDEISSASGIVMLAVVVGESGAVENAFVKDSSDPRFNQPSVAAIQAWEFVPLTRDSQPTRGLMFVPLQY